MLSYRYFFGWTGGTLMGAFATIFVLVPTATIGNGMFNVEGHGQVGAIAAMVIFMAMMVSSIGTHKMIPDLKAPPPPRQMTIGLIYREVFETLASRSFLALFLAALFGAVAAGVSTTLSFYFSTFFWEFTTEQIGLISLSVVISAVLAFFIAPVVSRKFGKKRGAITVGLMAFTVAPAPIFLRLLGLMPDNSDPSLFPLVLSITVIDVALIITYQILSSSMIADLVEEAEIKTKRRNEGVFFASVTFIRKVTQGIGAAVAGVLLTVSQFPAGATPDQVPESVLSSFGWLYVPVIFSLWMMMIASLSLYSVDRKKHEQNLATLRAED
jgi:Na+/melibiose symporter-like transporter